MLNKYLQSKNVKVLSKEQLKETHGGILTITCEFSDGGNWSGQTNSYNAARNMARHCVEGGGSPDYQNSDYE